MKRMKVVENVKHEIGKILRVEENHTEHTRSCGVGIVLQWSTLREVHRFRANPRSKSREVDGKPDMISKDMVSYILSCHPPDDLSHDFGLAYEGAMPSTASYDITTFTDILRQLLLHRYRDCIVVLADKVC